MARRGLVAMVLVIVPLALLAAGCGGGSSGSSAPSTTTTAGASGAAGTQSAALTAFTSCLKQHGITTAGFGGFGTRPRGATGRFGPTGASGRRFGPSGASGRFGPTGASGRRGGGFGRNLTAAQQKAFTACRSKLPAGTGRFGGGGGGGGANPAFAKYTQCLAQHGVKFGTASASGAAFAKASKACAKLRPAVGGAQPTTTTG